MDWVDVGINLNIEYGELKKIEAEESLTDQRCMAMLHLWRRTQPRSAFVGYLANALTSANLQEIAEELDQLSNERFRHKIDA